MAGLMAEGLGDEVRWSVSHLQGEEWSIANVGTLTAFDVDIAGLTSVDQQRLTVSSPGPFTIPPTSGGVPFMFVSRLSISGPGNLVITYALDNGSPTLRTVVQIPAP